MSERSERGGGTSSQQQQYCLRWNNYQNNLTNVFDQLLQSEAFVDVTLACDGNSLKAHKMVLSACSPYFHALFFENPCKHPIVILKDVKWAELKAIVEFVYRGEINVSQEQLAPLLKVAEVLRIRGLADVNRGTSGMPQSAKNSEFSSKVFSRDGGERKGGEERREYYAKNPEFNKEFSDDLLFAAASAATSLPPKFPFSKYGANGNSGHGHQSSSSALHHMSRKRRKFSDERSTQGSESPPLPPPPFEDDEGSNQLEIDSTNGEYAEPVSPLGDIIDERPPSSLLSSAAQQLLGGLNAPNLPSTSSSSALSHVNEMDLKPGIVEMIREEERAKMMESSHGWLGGPSPGSLSDSYQYQIQSLWQKCWNTNQSGLHALRFRERGPLKSWRPETMAEAIFAVLREGLSLSQAARKFDIPYPTFVLYANRVHNMLGPSADGSPGNVDLLSDMRPKGRGRPQRILLGSWPEDHIRGVIRAVVFRDGGKDEMPFPFGREGSLSSSSNGLDMSLHQQLASMNSFLGLHGQSLGSGSNSISPNSNGPAPLPLRSPNGLDDSPAQKRSREREERNALLINLGLKLRPELGGDEGEFMGKSDADFEEEEEEEESVENICGRNNEKRSLESNVSSLEEGGGGGGGRENRGKELLDSPSPKQSTSNATSN